MIHRAFLHASLLLACLPALPAAAKSMILYDYQSDEVLKTITDDGSGAKIEKSAAALNVTFPEKGGKIVALPIQTDWSAYDYLVFDVTNPTTDPVNLQFEGVDKKHAAGHKPLGNYKDRFTDNVLLAPGNNTVKCPISHAWTCEVWANPVDTQNIAGFMLWLPKAGKTVTLTFGPMRLATADDFPDTEVKLFDFKDPAVLADWSNLDLPDATPKSPPAYGDKTHPLKFELSDQNATSGQHSLKITATGGDFPTITTTKIQVHDFAPYKSFHADITAPRTCVVIFRAMGEKSSRTSEWNAMTGRWEKACLLHAGLNHVSEILTAPQNIVSFDIALYHPHDGESIYIDNIHLSKLWPEETTPFRYRNPCMAGESIPGFPILDKKWEVLGTEGAFENPIEFARQFTGKFPTPVKPLSMDDVESQFKKKYEEMKAEHPKAVLAVFRQGDKGFDPANPDKVYTGWADATLWGHDPAGVYISGLKNTPSDHYDVFLRRRAALMKVDLSTIPNGSNILVAQLAITRSNKGDINKNGPTLMVAEACNRPFDAAHVTTFEYAKDQFWNEVDGMEWRGKDPDFLSLILAYGPSHLKVIPCDFTNAVRFWTDGTHPNNGFAYYSVYNMAVDYIVAYSTRASNINNRPAIFVIYEPAK